MNITPVLNASVVIQLHLLAALLALGLGRSSWPRQRAQPPIAAWAISGPA